jgi:hypothetical protein
MSRWVFALGLLLCAGCATDNVDCAVLCKRACSCRSDLGTAIVSRLPAKSPALEFVRQQLPDRLLERLLRSCPERCQRLTKSRRWREALARCRPAEPCASFAPCIAPLLEP